MHDDEHPDVAEFMKSYVSAGTPAVPVPQLAQGLVDALVQDSILQRILEQIHACPVRADQVVPTISSQDRFSLHRPRRPRPVLSMVEKLAELPKVGPRDCVIDPVPQMAQRSVERGDDHQGLHGLRPGHQGVHGSLPGQSSTALREEEHHDQEGFSREGALCRSLHAGDRKVGWGQEFSHFCPT